MNKRSVVVAMLLGAVAVTLGISGSAQASDRDTTIVVSNRSENLAQFPTNLGADFRFNSPIYRPGTNHVLGSDSGVCEQMPVRDGIADEYVCDTVFTFNDGSTVTASGKQRITAPVAVGAVTGGTGRFLGCDGTVTGVLDDTTSEPQDFRITIRLFC